MGIEKNLVMMRDHCIALEERHGAHNTHPLPVVLNRGQGPFVWDTDERRYFDFLGSYGALALGYGHPRVLDALIDQVQRLPITSRSFYNDVLGAFQQRLSRFLGYDKVLLMNTGGEAVETAIKLARRWGYEHKDILAGSARVVVCSGNYHGNTLALVGASTDPEAREGFGPFAPGFDIVPFNDLSALRRAVEQPEVVAFLVEPVQAEAGIVLPGPGYLAEAASACKKNKVLFIADEVQTGLGRTGRWLGAWSEGVRPDVVVLGKAIGAGYYPVSAVLADDEVMLGIKSSGQHGSTYAANPVAARVGHAVIDALEEEKLDMHAERLGAIMRQRLVDLSRELPFIQEVRGRGLLNAVLFDPGRTGSTAWELCLSLKDHGLLAKPTHADIIRLTPPINITEEQLDEALGIVEDTFRSIA